MLSKEEQRKAEEDCKRETISHILTVQRYINYFCSLLMERGRKHDDSKLRSPELEIFTEYTPKLKGLTYGSDEYKACLKEMDVALQHHYAENSHHPEHYKNGINDMTFVDLIEMFEDSKAASLRHDDGDFMKSIDINIKRFGIDDQLAQIMKNTAPLMFKYNIIVSGDNRPKTVYVADTIEAIRRKVRSDESLGKDLAIIIANGKFNEFEKDYFNSVTYLEDSDMTIEWVVNNNFK